MNCEKWVGMIVNSEALNLVCLEFRDKQETPCVLQDLNWKLQTGDRSASYSVMYECIQNYLREEAVKYVAIKESAASQSLRLCHLLAAELRGVVMAAASASSANVKTIQKAAISRTFGQRKVDDYISDDSFWELSLEGSLKKGSREAALVVMAAKKL